MVSLFQTLHQEVNSIVRNVIVSEIVLDQNFVFNEGVLDGRQDIVIITELVVAKNHLLQCFGTRQPLKHAHNTLILKCVARQIKLFHLTLRVDYHLKDTLSGLLRDLAVGQRDVLQSLIHG